MKNIFLLPTDKSSRIIKSSNDKIYFTVQFLSLDKEISCYPQNIFITNDEEIKIGDWFFVALTDKIGKCEDIITEKNIVLSHWCKKIILTTDQDLIKDGVQAIPDEFLEWFVKNPNCEFIETVNTSADYEGRFRYYDFKFPKQEKHYLSCCRSKEECYCKKQETLEETAYQNCKKSGFINTSYAAHCMQSFIDGVNWQAGRSYNEEEVLNLLILSSQNFYAQPFNVAEWFEQFKKK